MNFTNKIAYYFKDLSSHSPGNMMQNASIFQNTIQTYYLRINSYLKRKLGSYLPFVSFIFTLVVLICFASLPAIPAPTVKQIIITTKNDTATNTAYTNRTHVYIDPKNSTHIFTNSSQVNFIIHPKNTTHVISYGNRKDFASSIILYSALGIIFMYSALIIIRIFRILGIRSGSANLRRLRQERLQQLLRSLGRIRDEHGDSRALRSRIQLALMNRDFTGEDYEMLQALDERDAHGILGTANIGGLSPGEINQLPLRTLKSSDFQIGGIMFDATSSHSAIASTSTDTNSLINSNNINNSSHISSSVVHNTTPSHHSCSICLAPYVVNDVVRTLSCLHIFHKDCIDHWLEEHSTCPVCKSDALIPMHD